MSYERFYLDWTLTLSDKQDKRMSDTKIYTHPLVRVYQFCWVTATLMPLKWDYLHVCEITRRKVFPYEIKWMANITELKSWLVTFC